MELFEVCSDLETVCAEISRLFDMLSIFEEGVTECAELLKDGDGLSKYAAGRIDRQLSLMEVIMFRMNEVKTDLRTSVDAAYKVHWEQKADLKQ